MNQQEKALFVSSLVNNVANELLDQIKAGRIPEEWNGIELRWLLAQRFQDATLSTRHDRGNQRRFRSFKNEVLVRNL